MYRAGNGTRTRDPNLGKVVLYQLSYSRIIPRTANLGRLAPTGNRRPNVRVILPASSPGMEARATAPSPWFHTA
jgi:hypothetical protein